MSSQLTPITLSVQSSSGSKLQFDPRLAAPGSTMVTVDQVVQWAKQTCADYALAGTNGHTYCSSMVLSKTFFKSNIAASNSPVKLHDWEVDTPVHTKLHEPGKVAEAVKTVGVAITQPLLDTETVHRLRDVILKHPSFGKGIKEEEHSRYMNPLCSHVGSNAKESNSQPCHAWDTSFVELAQQETVLSEVEKILGSDCIIDSTAISVQWPGDAPFGPHVDRPFILDPEKDGEWSHSTDATKGMGLPPTDYPISVQVLWLLDHFSTTNGAFYYLPNLRQKKRGSKSTVPLLPRDVYPKGAQMITGAAGSVLFAHGGLLHGAAPNMHSRPRIAFLVQYVPKFVRPGKQYPLSILTPLLRTSTSTSTRSRLLELFDIDIDDADNTDVKSPFSDESNYFVHQKKATRPDASMLVIPPVAFGVGTSSAALSGDALRTIVREALLRGVRHLDLAEMYGNHKDLGILFNELWGPKAASAAAAAASASASASSSLPTSMPRREEVFVTSKLWTTNMDPRYAHQALLHTLKELQLEYLDAWLIHWPVPMVHTTIENPSKGAAWPQDEQGRTAFAKGYTICDTWKSMEASQRQGLTKHLGVSNFSPSLLHMVLGCSSTAHPLINQVESHPYLPQTELLKFCRANNVILQAYSPLASGNEGTQRLLNEPAVLKVAEKLNATPAQVVLKWNLQRGVPVVSTTRRVERITAMLESTQISMLTEEDMHSINEISSKHRERFVAPEQFRFVFA